MNKKHQIVDLAIHRLCRARVRAVIRSFSFYYLGNLGSENTRKHAVWAILFIRLFPPDYSIFEEAGYVTILPEGVLDEKNNHFILLSANNADGFLCGF